MKSRRKGMKQSLLVLSLAFCLCACQQTPEQVRRIWKNTGKTGR